MSSLLLPGSIHWRWQVINFTKVHVNKGVCVCGERGGSAKRLVLRLRCFTCFRPDSQTLAQVKVREKDEKIEEKKRQ